MMRGCTCTRCGEPGPYFVEYPDVDKGAPRTTSLCEKHARELAGIIRDYEDGRTIVCFTKHRGADE